MEKVLENVKRIKAIAETGLIYAKDNFDIERYQEIQEIVYSMLSELTELPIEKLKSFYLPVNDYPTPKVDVRAILINEQDQILMVKEKSDGKWTIPGGWADVGLTPKEVILKEIEEEVGVLASVVRLLAVYDKKCHPHPPQPFYVYKMVFYCHLLDGAVFKPSFEIEEVKYFNVDKLPSLSTDRILSSQILDLYHKIKNDDLSVFVD